MNKGKIYNYYISRAITLVKQAIVSWHPNIIFYLQYLLFSISGNDPTSNLNLFSKISGGFFFIYSNTMEENAKEEVDGNQNVNESADAVEDSQIILK